MNNDLPLHYRNAIRALLRFAIAMVVVALLVGISFQESARKLPFDKAPPGLHIEAIVQLALVHGHVFMMAVLIPIAMAGLLVLARRVGGAEIGPRPLAWLVRGYLPSAVAAIALMLFKGYWFLLHVRWGVHDLAAVDAAFLGGPGPLRYGLYGLVHSLMGLTLCLFLYEAWRSMGRRAAEAGTAPAAG